MFVVALVIAVLLVTTVAMTVVAVVAVVFIMGAMVGVFRMLSLLRSLLAFFRLRAIKISKGFFHLRKWFVLILRRHHRSRNLSKARRTNIIH